MYGKKPTLYDPHLDSGKDDRTSLRANMITTRNLNTIVTCVILIIVHFA